jgi:uncharacterized membrane protein HdeD (DUF308 family)
MSAINSSVKVDGASALFHRHWGWLLAFAIVQVIAGAFAVAIPALASLIAVAMFGWVMIISAIFQIVHAFRVRKWRGFALHLLGGVLYAVAGVLALLYPFPSVVALTLFLAGLLLADGILRTILSSAMRPQEGWGWFLAGGIASIVLGLMLIFGFPSTAVWAIGLLLGVNLIFGGAMNGALALACRRRQKEEPRDDTGPKHAAAEA